MERVYTGNKGFTLLEFLVAVVIIAVGLLGLLQAINISFSHNLVNIFRNQAVILADERMALEKTKPFANISTTTSSRLVSINVKDANTFKNYSVVKTGSVLTSNTTNLQVDVIWRHKGTRYIHSVSSLVSRYQ